MSKCKRAVIDYGCGIAEFWGSFTKASVERQFMRHANQCFGIRKSIMGFELKSIEPSVLPEPWCLMTGAATVLKHSGDIIVWNEAGDKIKSEFD